jgi:DNA-directed RNA polymerase specialized sigma24 family protein
VAALARAAARRAAGRGPGVLAPRRREAADCLEQLPLPQRSAFLLHHDDGLAARRVARALEVGFETAKTRLRYAMSKLRTCMGAYLEPLQPGGAR